jgi:hypothetical protein
MTAAKHLLRNAIKEQEKKWLQSLCINESKKIIKQYNDNTKSDRTFTYTVEYIIDLKDQNTQNNNQHHEN